MTRVSLLCILCFLPFYCNMNPANTKSCADTRYINRRIHTESDGQRRYIMNYPFPYSPNLAIEYSFQISPLLKKKADIYDENQQLSSLRDFLLPMLMNGQVKVKCTPCQGQNFATMDSKSATFRVTFSLPV